MKPAMHYAELPLPPALEGWVAAAWTASMPADGPEWVEQEAVPDGCIELIRRLGGSSFWRREQPALFATGLATTPAQLRLGSGSSFAAVRLWPWAWQALGGRPCREFHDDWVGIAPASPLAGLMDGPLEVIVERLAAIFAALELPAYALALQRETTVAGVAREAGMGHRRLQRIFERDYGMPPRAYLRLLRFRGALAGVSGSESLAGVAAEGGYADQAHMSREFRSLAGVPPSAARARAKGPFV
jgi:AraC-like DNA-binding protein